MCSGTNILIKVSMVLSLYCEHEYSVKISFKLMFACERNPRKLEFLARQSEPHACIFEDIGVTKSIDDACPAGFEASMG